MFSARDARLHGAPAGDGCSVNGWALDAEETPGLVSDKLTDDVGILFLFFE